MTRFVVVTGTSTDVGKTIVTAALAATASGRVLVVKPVQTGVTGAEPGDADVVARLTGVDVVTFATLDEPLAPDTAARRAGVDLPLVSLHASRVRELAADYDVVIVEGAGGLLVRLDTHRGTLLDITCSLANSTERSEGRDTLEVVVVCAAGLGTLNHTELTTRTLRRHDVEPTGLVIGSWPAEPGLAETCNADDLPLVTGVPLLGRVPEGVGTMTSDEFVAAASTWLERR